MEALDVFRELQRGKFSCRRLALLLFITPIGLSIGWQSLETGSIPDVPRGTVAVIAILAGATAVQRKPKL